MYRRSVLLLLLFLFNVTPTLAQTLGPRVEIEEYGLYDASLDPAARTAEQVRLLKKTWRAPAEAGAFFGLRFRLVSGAPATVRVLVTHPAVEDPTSGRKVQQYELERSLEPGALVFQGQRVEQDGRAAVGRWVFQIYAGETVLAEREFEVYATESRAEPAKPVAAPVKAGSDAGGFLVKDPTPCRSLDSALLRSQFPGRRVIAEQSFGLALPVLGACCFLTLQGASAGEEHALVTLQGRVLAKLSPAPLGKTKAVSFEDFNGDGQPEIVLVTEPQGEGPANRVYWSLVYGRAVYWTNVEAVDKELASLRRAPDLLERLRAARTLN